MKELNDRAAFDQSTLILFETLVLKNQKRRVAEVEVDFVALGMKETGAEWVSTDVQVLSLEIGTLEDNLHCERWFVSTKRPGPRLEWDHLQRGP